MKKVFCFWWALSLCGFSSFAQTNVPSVDSTPHFFLPPVQLWQPALPEETTSTNTLGVGTISDASSTGQMSLNSLANDGEFRSRVIRPGEFYLIQAQPVAENRFVRAAEVIWSPEVVHLGKTTVSCPVITAIKRKNPLCLLNPIFFQASW
jgi:hypothetical protein